MCGIIFETSTKKNVNESIGELYENQRGRGDDGFGLLTIDQNQKFNLHRSEIEAIFINKLFENKSKTILVHHRTPTSTDNEREQTHPMFVNDKRLKYEYYIVHNGIIFNKEDCREKFEKDGFEIKTAVDDKKFNDSEAFAIDLAMHIENKWKDWTARGSIAFVALQVERKTQKVEKVLFGRNTNPLNLYIKKSKKIISSLTVSSEGPGEEIDKDILYSLDLSTMKLSSKKFEIGSNTYSTYYSKKDSRGYFDSDDGYGQYGGYNYGGRSYNEFSHNKMIQNKTGESDIVDGFGNKVVINVKDDKEPVELTEEQKDKIEEVEEAISDELTEYINDEKAFGIYTILEEAIENLSSINFRETFNRNKVMAKIAKAIMDMEDYRKSLEGSYSDFIDWNLKIEKEEINPFDEIKETEEDEIKVHRV